MNFIGKLNFMQFICSTFYFALKLFYLDFS